MPREQLYVPKESSFPTRSKRTDNVKHTNTDLDKSGENGFDDLGNIDGKNSLRRKLKRIHEIRHPEQASTPKVIHGWLVG